jgi:hypothetical protein
MFMPKRPRPCPCLSGTADLSINCERISSSAPSHPISSCPPSTWLSWVAVEGLTRPTYPRPSRSLFSACPSNSCTHRTGTYLSHVILPGKTVSLLSKQVRRHLCIHCTHYIVTACGILMRSSLSRFPLPGSGMGTLQQLLNSDTALFDKMTAHQIYSFIQLVKTSLLPLRDDGRHDDRLSFALPPRSCFIISHAHLDHVNGLILSAGSLPGPRKRICASLSTLKSLETIFADRIWPNLASWDTVDAAYKLLYDPCVHF